MNEAVPQHKWTGYLIWMLISQILTIFTLSLWLSVALISYGFGFDQGSTPEAWTFVIAIWSYPIIPIVLVIAAWIAFARRKYILAAVLSGFSFMPPFLCLAFILVLFAI